LTNGWQKRYIGDPELLIDRRAVGNLGANLAIARECLAQQGDNAPLHREVRGFCGRH